MKKIFLLLVMLNLCQHQAFAQNPIMDSLNKALQNAKQDTIRLRIYLALCEACDVKDNLKYGKPTLELLNKLIAQIADGNRKKEYLKQKAIVYNVFIAYYNDKNDTAQICEYLQNILSIFQEAKDTDNFVSSIIEFSNFYRDIGNFPKALEFSQKAISISKEWNYKKGIARSLYHIADMYRDQGEKTQAIENYQHALSILYEIKDTNLLVNGLLSIGGLYRTADYYNKALALCEAKHWNDKICYIYKFIGEIEKEHSDFSNSLLNYQKSLSKVIASLKQINTYTFDPIQIIVL